MEHQHGSSDQTTSSLRLAFFLNLGFTLLEIVGGLWTNSIAILSDALHDLGDSISLGMAWYFNNYAQKAPDADFSYGYRRFSMLGALINTVILIAGSLWVLVTAVPRLLNPEQTNVPGMVGFALVGMLVNGLAAYRLYRNESLNAQVAGWHLLEDVLGWTAVFIVSLILLFTDWVILDPILSILITLYILFNVVGKLRRTARLFLQATPENLNVPDIERQIRTLAPVKDVHHTHVWSLDGEHHVLTTHIVVPPETTKEAASQLKWALARQLKNGHFEHLTLEIEFGEDDCRLKESVSGSA
ncbi:MAG: cation transporter [Anaerolineaceae bacterium]|nr:cation transporter [Anaerolineaceae bacterium]